MSQILAAHGEEMAAGRISVAQGTYVTAAAIVLREILLEVPPEHGAEEFLERVNGSVHEDEDGVVTVDTFAMLDDIADHVELYALTGWLADPTVRKAIAEVTESAPAE
jgi:hypothetical protein